MDEHDLTTPHAPPPPERGAGERRPAGRGAGLAARLWQLLGGALIVAGMAVTLTLFARHILLKNSSGGLDLGFALLAGLAAAASGAGVIAFNRGKKLRAVSAREKVLKDPRPPVLYLRSFKDDPAGATTAQTGLFGAQFNVQTEEESLAKAVGDLGPFIAVGRPGEKLPELGAARIYFADDEWEEGVTALMALARLVILRPGETTGIWWEVRRAVETLPPERLLLLIPFEESSYALFREDAHRYFPRELPDYQGSALLRTSIKGYIYFDQGWVPHFVKLKAPLTRAVGFGGELERKLRSSLRPVYEQLGAPWTPPRFKWTYNGLVVGSVIALMLLSVVIIHWMAGPRSLSADAVERSTERLAESPEIKRAIAGLSARQADALVSELSRKGLSRLDDASLLLRAGVLTKIYLKADVIACEEMAQGSITPGRFKEVLKKLEPADIEAFYLVIEKSALAELRQTPAPRLGEREVVDSCNVLRGRVSNYTPGLTPVSGCLWSRELFEKLPQLEEPHRSILLRAMVADDDATQALWSRCFRR